MWYIFPRGHMKIESLRLHLQTLYNPEEPREKKKKKKNRWRITQAARWIALPGLGRALARAAWPGSRTNTHCLARVARAGARPKPGSAVCRATWVLLRPIQVLLFRVLLSFSFWFFFFFFSLGSWYVLGRSPLSSDLIVVFL